jgi:hypothetical protein
MDRRCIETTLIKKIGKPDLGFAGGVRKTPPQVGPRRGFQRAARKGG